MTYHLTRTLPWTLIGLIAVGLVTRATPITATDPPRDEPAAGADAPASAADGPASSDDEPAALDPRSLAIPDPEVDPDMDDDGGIAKEVEAYRKRLRQIADAYAAPPGGKQLTKLPDLWIDRDAKRVYIDGYVTMRRGPLEMFACPVGTKEHESIVAVFVKSSQVHAALLSIGAEPGKPVQWEPEFVPPSGQRIAVWVTWRDADGKFQVADARDWLINTENDETLDRWWVFAGSKIWTDPADGTEHYTADGGDLVCVSNFSTAMLDVPFDSSANAGSLLFRPFTDRIPEDSTSVRLVLAPLPETDPVEGDAGEETKDGEADPKGVLTPPDESVVPVQP